MNRGRRALAERARKLPALDVDAVLSGKSIDVHSMADAYGRAIRLSRPVALHEREPFLRALGTGLDLTKVTDVDEIRFVGGPSSGVKS